MPDLHEASTQLLGRTVLVTGAGSGLGRAYTLDLLRRGATVVANDIDSVALEAVVAQAAGGHGRCVAIPASVCDWDAAGALIERSAAVVGHLDAVVSNAGVFTASRAVDETEAQIRRLVEINLLGTAFVGIHALRLFQTVDDGLLLNTTSGAYLGLAETGSYAASKGGVVSMSACWAEEVRGTGVRVNVLAPRALTPMSRVRGAAGSMGALPPERVAPVVAALLSKAGRSINGIVLSFDGVTMSVMERPRVRTVGREEHWTDESLVAAIDHVQLRPPR